MKTIPTPDGEYRIFHISEQAEPRNPGDAVNTGPWLYEPVDYVGDTQWAPGERTEEDAENAAFREAYESRP